MADPITLLDDDVSVKIKQAALTGLSATNATTVSLAISAEVYAQGRVFNLVDSKMVVREAAALVFIDRNPGANWGHPCTYQFYDPATGALLYEEDAFFPPNLAGGTTLTEFHRPGALAIRAATAAVSPVAAELLVPLPPQPVVSSAIEQRYAILWTSQISDRRHVEDLEFMWRALVNVYGFTPANIHVLCYNGTLGSVDYNPLGNWAGNNTPYQMQVNAAATVANLQAVVNTLAGKLKPKDMLLVHTNNHGAPSGMCVDDSSVVTPNQFATMIAGLPNYRTLIVTMEQCYSGAFQGPVLQTSTATNTVFASAVPANLESAGAAHFDPWAEDLIAALNGTMPSGAALANKPTSNFDGLISIKGACDWAKLTDTGTGDVPQYGDNPAGCGASIFLGTEPVRANQTGDVNADGCVEIVVTSPWGLGILEQEGSTFACLMLAPNGTRFGQWLLNTADNVIAGLADFEGDNQAGILMTSPWGLGILQLSGGTLTSTVMVPNGTKIGGWTLDTTSDYFGPLADYDGDGRAEILVTGPSGIAVLKPSGTTLTALAAQPNGARLGQWLFENNANTIGPAGDYDGDGKIEILITSPWGVGILKLAGGSFTSPMLQPNGTRFGGWLLDTSNNNLGRCADYDGDGADEILATSPWGIGILKVTGSTMNSVMLAPNGTRFGEWLFNSPDDIIGPASTYTGTKQAGLMVSSAWGIGVLQLSGGTLGAPAMQPNGTRFGGWLLDTSNNRFGEAASYDGQPATGLLVTSPWGIGILKLAGNSFTSSMLQPNGTRFGGWLLNTADNQF
jgi:hypothetical protein